MKSEHSVLIFSGIVTESQRSVTRLGPEVTGV